MFPIFVSGHGIDDGCILPCHDKPFLLLRQGQGEQR